MSSRDIYLRSSRFTFNCADTITYQTMKRSCITSNTVEFDLEPSSSIDGLVSINAIPGVYYDASQNGQHNPQDNTGLEISVSIDLATPSYWNTLQPSVTFNSDATKKILTVNAETPINIASGGRITLQNGPTNTNFYIAGYFMLKTDVCKSVETCIYPVCYEVTVSGTTPSLYFSTDPS